MNLTPLEVILVGVLLAIVGHGLIVLFRSPKEIWERIEERQDEIEDKHNGLAKLFERHDEVSKNLIRALDRLTDRVDKLEPRLRRNGP